jgi:hypothetical protein
MKKFVFRDQLTGMKYIIPLLDGPVMDSNQLLDSFYYNRIMPEIESRNLEIKYGIHDFNTESDDELFGFTSYEIETPEAWKELMLIWRDILVLLGYKIGETIKIQEK